MEEINRSKKTYTKFMKYRIQNKLLKEGRESRNRLVTFRVYCYERPQIYDCWQDTGIEPPFPSKYGGS